VKICGIDPGASGAMCVLDSQDPAHIALLDLKKHSIYDSAQWLHDQKVDIVWIEDVHSLFGMSAKSNFGFGRNLGYAIAISQIGTSGAIARTVAPKVWQKYIGVTVKGKAIKNQVAQIAASIYPSASLHGKLGGLLDGRSDALMLAYYGINHP
tara:strand:+ start:2672 stop:3130 length:459 start_codon:yes stop_codon:yes gene_type:complete